MTGDNKRKTRSGFTLVEALVTMAIFTILMVSVSSIYVQNLRFARQIISRTKLQADARYALETLTRAIRVSDLDYAAWGGTLPAQPTTELRLINLRTGDTGRIRLESTSWETAAQADANCHNDGKSYPCITVSTDGGTTWAPLTPRGVKIDNLRFYATPSRDPFNFNQESGAYDSDALSTDQPIITISVQFHGLGIGAVDTAGEWTYSLQTTVTPRLYLR
jgi:prepilin-type N-terminal cleavage/methylation domain-containing protein